MIEAVPSGRTGLPRAIVVYSGSHVVRDGVIGLLPEGWRSRAEQVDRVEDLGRPGDRELGSVIVDGDAPAPLAALAIAAERGATTVLILGSRAAAPELLTAADAILLRDELEPIVLRLALAAGRAGVRLVPRTLPLGAPVTTVRTGSQLSEPARQVLALLAEGRRDAEIAVELSISESAVRKLVQRTVQALGARTRYQAIAIVAREEAASAASSE